MPLFGQRHANGRGATGRGAPPYNAYDTQGVAPAGAYNNDTNGAPGGRSGVARNEIPAGRSSAPATGNYAAQGPGYGATGPAGTNFSGGAGGQMGQTSDMADGSYGNTVGNNEVAPVTHFSSGQSKGTSSSMSGKMERIVGTMVCSQSLKNKGAEKERAAQAHQSQRLELSEAERLEQEALVRRERAVAHGAHPANKALGGPQAQEYGGNFGQTATTGAGANPGNPAIPNARGGAI